MKKLLAASAASLAFAGLIVMPAHAQTTLSNPSGALTTSGSRTLKGGEDWTPYGITLSNLQNENQTYVPGALATIEAELESIATTWHGNMVRIQIEQDEYLNPTPHSGYASNYYQTLTIDAIDYAESLGLVVVINDQTEANSVKISSTSPNLNVGNASNEEDPTAATEQFWLAMSTATNASGTPFTQDPNVILDLFNEPRLLNPVNNDPDWGVWQNGGTINGVTYIGYQALVDYVRSLGYTSQIWLENVGTNNWEYVNEHTSAEISDPDHNVVYTFHHTDNGDTTPNKASWAAEFGNLVTEDNLPVVDGEWTNRTYFPSEWPGAAGNGNAGQCWADAPTMVPQYLSYLASLHIGMTIWTLGPDPLDQAHDVLNTDSGYGDPDSYSGWSGGCEEKSNTGTRHGAGLDVMNWFGAQDTYNP